MYVFIDYIYIYMYISLIMYVYTYMIMYVCVYTLLCMYIRISVHMYIYIYMYEQWLKDIPVDDAVGILWCQYFAIDIGDSHRVTDTRIASEGRTS